MADFVPMSVHELEFDLKSWSIRNEFKDLYSKLEEMGVSTEEDLALVTEDDLNDMGVTKPFIRRKFFLKANETYNTYLTTSKNFENREIETKKFQHDLILLSQLKTTNAISESEYNQMRVERTSKYFKFFDSGGGDDGLETPQKNQPSIQIYPIKSMHSSRSMSLSSSASTLQYRPGGVSQMQQQLQHFQQQLQQFQQQLQQFQQQQQQQQFQQPQQQFRQPQQRSFGMRGMGSFHPPGPGQGQPRLQEQPRQQGQQLQGQQQQDQQQYMYQQHLLQQQGVPVPNMNYFPRPHAQPFNAAGPSYWPTQQHSVPKKTHHPSSCVEI